VHKTHEISLHFGHPAYFHLSEDCFVKLPGTTADTPNGVCREAWLRGKVAALNP
jgi:hypothetical protein